VNDEPGTVGDKGSLRMSALGQKLTQSAPIELVRLVPIADLLGHYGMTITPKPSPRRDSKYVRRPRVGSDSQCNPAPSLHPGFPIDWHQRRVEEQSYGK
jgi:hypothetical protein